MAPDQNPSRGLPHQGWAPDFQNQLHRLTSLIKQAQKGAKSWDNFIAQLLCVENVVVI
jgi:hypothetical protein